MIVNEDDIEAIAAKSIINCHALGVDSILFADTPSARVRAFIANPYHTLWRNYGSHGHSLSVALHPHHCDVVLKRIFGTIWNIKPVGAIAGRRFSAHKYVSPITTGHGSFVRADPGDDILGRLTYTEMNHQSISMKASEEHTIYVPHGSSAAWWVCEGDDDPNYNGLCYSDDDLERFDFAPLYKPMSVDYLRGLLGQLGIQVGE
jgi:hypothetical protein